jgi:hypothetical protein
MKDVAAPAYGWARGVTLDATSRSGSGSRRGGFGDFGSAAGSVETSVAGRAPTLERLMRVRRARARRTRMSDRPVR